MFPAYRNKDSLDRDSPPALDVIGDHYSMKRSCCFLKREYSLWRGRRVYAFLVGWLAPEEMLIANSGMDVEELTEIRELFDVSAMLDSRVWIAL